MPVPTDTDLLLDVLAREDRSLLPATPTTHPVHSGNSTDDAVDALVTQAFLAAVRREGLARVRIVTVPRTDDDLGDAARFGAVEASWSTPSCETALVTLEDGCLALLEAGDSRCTIVVAGRDPALVGRASERLADALRAEPIPDDKVPMRFWSGSGDVGYDVRRAIDVPEWSEIERNYPRPVREALAALLAAEKPGAGSLILWHGPPGTGKTHAVQALARAWRSWCSVHCVTDPEKLLRSPGYLMDVVNDTIGEDERAWRLIVLEDAGELMTASARAEIGQGLSRVLNLTDGLLGQGVRCILLVTTNEPVGRLHPAVRRPGRCWASIELGPFDPAEATAWLALQGVEKEVRRPMTLAELYAIAEDREIEEIAGEGFGFARALSR